MTMTAPLPLVNLDLAVAVRAGVHLIRHQVRLQPTLLLTPLSRTGARPTVDVGAWASQLADAQAVIRRAIERTLDAVGVSTDEGLVDYRLDRDQHGVTLTGTWQPW